MSQQYRILCLVHGYQYVWSDTLVTTCPVDPADELNSDATCIVAQLRPVFQLSPNVSSVTSSYLMRICATYLDENMGVLMRVGILSYAEEGVNSYTVEIYDKANFRTIGSSTFTNKDDYSLNKISVNYDPTVGVPLSNLEINVSVDSSIFGKCVKISKIIFYAL
jgi:hypothetical protein